MCKNTWEFIVSNFNWIKFNLVLNRVKQSIVFITDNFSCSSILIHVANSIQLVQGFGKVWWFVCVGVLMIRTFSKA